MVGSFCLSLFTFSRATTNEAEKIPGLDEITEEDVVLGLYEGFMEFKNKVPQFNFVLSPCFRKEANFFDAVNFDSKKEPDLVDVEFNISTYLSKTLESLLAPRNS